MLPYFALWLEVDNPKDSGFGEDYTPQQAISLILEVWKNRFTVTQTYSLECGMQCTEARDDVLHVESSFFQCIIWLQSAPHSPTLVLVYNYIRQGYHSRTIYIRLTPHPALYQAISPRILLSTISWFRLKRKRCEGQLGHPTPTPTSDSVFLLSQAIPSPLHPWLV